MNANIVFWYSTPPWISKKIISKKKKKNHKIIFSAHFYFFSIIVFFLNIFIQNITSQYDFISQSWYSYCCYLFILGCCHFKTDFMDPIYWNSSVIVVPAIHFRNVAQIYTLSNLHIKFLGQFLAWKSKPDFMRIIKSNDTVLGLTSSSILFSPGLSMR